MRSRAVVIAGAVMSVLATGGSPVALADDPERARFGDLEHFALEHRSETRRDDARLVQGVRAAAPAELRQQSDHCTEGRLESDPSDVTALDLSSVRIDYCPDTQPFFVVGAGTYDGWVRDQLEGFLVDLDTDLNAGTGCAGADFSAFGYYDYTYGLVAGIFKTPSCDDGTWTYRGDAYIDRAGAIDFIGMGWDAAQIDAPTTFRWSVFLSDGYETDRAPNTGHYSFSIGSAPPPSNYPTPTARDIGNTCESHQSSPFTDIVADTHEYAIRCVFGRGIAQGKTSSTYDPSGTLTQGQTATFLARTLTSAGRPVPEPQDFCSEGDDVHVQNMERLMAANVLPRPANRICAPNAPITREIMADWVRNALASAGVIGDSRTNWYADDDGSPLHNAINEITSLGIVTGKGNALYGPRETLSRAQMATFLARSLDALLEAPSPT